MPDINEAALRVAEAMRVLLDHYGYHELHERLSRKSDIDHIAVTTAVGAVMDFRDAADEARGVHHA